MSTYELHFDHSRPPLTLNQRMHWAPKAKITAMLRRETQIRARAEGIPHLGRIRVSLIWVVRDRRKRDAGENLAPTFKAQIDGLVDAGLVDDDDPSRVVRDSPIVSYQPMNNPHLLLRITQLPPEEVAA